MSNNSISIRPVAGALGAEIQGVNLAEPLGNQLYQEIHDALMAHQVIFFRDQDITPEQHIAFGRAFGELNVHPYARHIDGHPEVLVLESRKGKRSAANAWHSDLTCEERPPMGSILLAREVPDYGGDTMWANMYAAYDALSEPMKRYLEGMKAVHTAATQRFEKIYDKAVDKADKEKVRERRMQSATHEHPVVRTHPVTGRKALFVNRVFTERLAGVRSAESKAILHYLYEHLARPEFTCRFAWREGSIAFWDNRCTQHYAVSDYGDATRVMHRVTVEGDRPG